MEERHNISSCVVPVCFDSTSTHIKFAVIFSLNIFYFQLHSHKQYHNTSDQV